MCCKNCLILYHAAVYNSGMIRYTALLFAFAAATVGAAPAAPVPVTAADAQLQQKLQDVLRAMVKSGSEDFYDAASLVLNATGDESAFLPMMEKAAAAGSSAAQYWLAMRLLPVAVPGTAEHARLEQLVNKAVSGKYSPAMILASQLKAETNPTAALTVLMEACRLGNAKARALYLLQSGRLANGNLSLPEVASELKKNNHYLEEIIANMQTTELKAFEWMQKASAHGSSTAPYILSQTLMPGDTEEDCLKRLITAADRHNVMALYMYGLVNLRGNEFYEGVQNNAAEAKRLLQLAAMLGAPEAAVQLAVFYSTGELPGGDAARIYRLFEYASQCGIPAGMAGVGVCKVLGAGCKADAEGGLKLLNAVREKGDQWVNKALASLYFNGCGGLKPDLRKALDYLTEDAAQGGYYSYAIAAGLAAVGNSVTPPDASMADYYLNTALSNPEIAGMAREIYDVIVASEGWRFMPVLEQSVPNEQK